MNPRRAIHGGRVLLEDLLGKEAPSGLDNRYHMRCAVEWLCSAQDSTPDGGVSEGYHLYHGWLPSYPETTGYIIETFFDYGRFVQNGAFSQRALRMADWLLSIQGTDGSIQNSTFEERLVFDTGQVLFGLTRAYRETGVEKYRRAAVRAGEWLTQVQCPDGRWTRFAFNEIAHTYYSRVAWSLLRLHEITREDGFREAARRNLHWTADQQRSNGWFDQAGFTLKDHAKPSTHTIAYTIRGLLESGLYLSERQFVDSAATAMDALLANLPTNGRQPGTYDAGWTGDRSFSCLTGNAQFAIVLFRLHEHLGERRYLRAARQINGYMRSRQELRVQGFEETYGAIAGSYPLWGPYIHYCYPNWAAKFFVDALLLEETTAGSDRS